MFDMLLKILIAFSLLVQFDLTSITTQRVQKLRTANHDNFDSYTESREANGVTTELVNGFAKVTAPTKYTDDEISTVLDDVEEVLTKRRSTETITENETTPANIEMVSNDLFYIGVVALLCLGFCGNSVGIIVMQKGSFKKYMISFIIITLAVSDNIVLVLLPFNKEYITRWVGFDLRSVEQLSCTLLSWLMKVSKITSSWFVVLISLERFIAVWFPLKARSLITKTSVYISIGLTYVIVGGFCGIWSYFTDKIIDGKCIASQSSDDNQMLEKLLAMIGGMMYAFMPIFLIFVLNALTVSKIIHHQRQREELGEHQQVKSDTSKITATLLSITIAFLILVVPVCLIRFFPLFFMNAFDGSTVENNKEILQGVLLVLEALNHSVNFYLYSMCSSVFRNEVRNIFTCSKTSKNSYMTSKTAA